MGISSFKTIFLCTKFPFQLSTFFSLQLSLYADFRSL